MENELTRVRASKPRRPNEEPYMGKLFVRFREGLGRQLPSLLDSGFNYMKCKCGNNRFIQCVGNDIVKIRETKTELTDEFIDSLQTPIYRYACSKCNRLLKNYSLRVKA